MAYLMIVDDDKDFADSVAIALVREGHEVATQPSTSAAMAEMQSRAPDLVILDVMFPGDDFAGFELARAMHECRSLSKIPILMLTSLNEKHGLNFSTLDTDNSWLPVAEFVDKFMDPEELVRKVTSLLQAPPPPAQP